MADRTESTDSQSNSADTGTTTDALETRGWKSRWLIGGAVIVLAAAVILSLWPVLTAPVAGDDRYWTVETPARFGNSYIDVFVGTWRDTPIFAQAGRLTPLANLGRRLMGMAIFQVSLVFTTPFVFVHGLAKLILLVVGAGACILFVRVLRWRSTSGDLVRASRPTLIAVGAAFVGLIAAGVTSHFQFRNAWTAYPLLTYGSITAVFGSAALLVASARRVALGKKGAVIVAFFVSLVLAVLLNWTYELYYVGVPLALVSLWAFPLVSERLDASGRSARRLVGGMFLFLFASGFVATRVLLSGICSGDECYAGTTIAFGPEATKTFWFNLISSVPGGTGGEFLRDMESIDAPVTASVYSGEMWIVSVALGVAVWAVWRWSSQRMSRGRSMDQAESRLLLVAGLFAIATGVGGALIMSISAQSQEFVERIGIPYRHTALTWTSLALGIALLLRAWELRSPQGSGRAALAIGCILIVAASAFTLPRNVYSTRAHINMPSNAAIADIHWEIIKGDDSDLGDLRRCISFFRAEEAFNVPWLEMRLEPAADELFRQLWGVPYCSTWIPA